MEESKSDKSGFLRFVISRKFFVSLAIAGIILIVLFFVLVKFLDVFTRHGNELEVPNFNGKTLKQIDSLGYANQFDFFIIDSMHSDKATKGSVAIQNPIPGSKVKKGRNIYFTIVASTPEMVYMPDLKFLTLRQAINVLASSKLQTGKLIYQPSFDKNAILEQFFDNDTVFPGDTLVKGSVIDLVIGSGDRNYKIPVPFLVGLTREEAIREINMASFNLGSEFYLDSIMGDSNRVFMQEPMWDSEFAFYPGDSVHMWYRSVDSVDFEIYLNTFLPDSLQTDSLMVDTVYNF
jgi:beta-lactam-binding protein with PASTA domain